MKPSSPMILNFCDFSMSLERPIIMGILNVTPDSFSDGGLFANKQQALIKAQQMIVEGVDILDVGGESTRPGAAKVSEQQELDRVIPLIEALKGFDCPISVDTRKPKVMKEALGAGVSMINDVTALESEESIKIVAEADVPVCLMHMRGLPQTMQQSPTYENIVDEVIEFLIERAKIAQGLGVKQQNIVLDPGFGFGKTLAHNVALFKSLDRLVEKGYPVLVGLSRKSMLGEITGKNVTDRMPASITSAMLAVQAGVKILRVHDVSETKDMLRVLDALDESILESKGLN